LEASLALSGLPMSKFQAERPGALRTSRESRTPRSYDPVGPTWGQTPKGSRIDAIQLVSAITAASTI
jgi:hypothetical protein